MIKYPSLVSVIKVVRMMTVKECQNRDSILPAITPGLITVKQSQLGSLALASSPLDPIAIYFEIYLNRSSLYDYICFIKS